MVELVLSDWLKPDEFPENGELKGQFYDEGLLKEQTLNGEQKQVFEIGVQFLRDKQVVQRRWTMNKTSQRAVAELYGPETKQWVGQPVEIFLNTENVQGKMRKVMYARGRV